MIELCESEEKLARPTSSLREGSNESLVNIAEATNEASDIDKAKTDGQSILGQQGTRPRELKEPTVGFNPTTLFNDAGIRPDPPVSVPMENDTW